MRSSGRKYLLVSFIAIFSAISAYAGVSYEDDPEDEQPSPIARCQKAFAHAPTIIKSVVERSVDGDTVKIAYKNESFSVRFLGIDTPETKFLGKNQGKWAFVAKDFMTEALPPKSKVTLEFEGDRCDIYGRVLAYVYRENIQINRLVIEGALGVSYCIYPNTRYCVEFGQKVEQLRKEKKGIYGDKTLVVPYVWRRMVSDRPMDKFVGSMKTKRVYPPNYWNEIPLGERIFFRKKSEIFPPFEFFPKP